MDFQTEDVTDAESVQVEETRSPRVKHSFLGSDGTGGENLLLFHAIKVKITCSPNNLFMRETYPEGPPHK